MNRLLGGTENELFILGLVKGPLPAGMTGTSGGLGGHGITGVGIPGTTSSHCETSTTLKSLEGLHVYRARYGSALAMCAGKACEEPMGIALTIVSSHWNQWPAIFTKEM